MEVNQQNPQDNLKNKKKLWIIWGVLTGLAVLALIIVVILMNISPQPTTSRKKAPDSFSLLPGKEPIMYAGNQVYDACNLISFDTVRTHIKNYQTLLDSIKTNQRPVQPLVIEHNYIDRNISTILGNDGQARAKGTIIGATDEGISQFTSLSDSNCWYGQGEGLSRGKGTTFVKTYVIQKPTPISGDLLSYINSLSPLQVKNGIHLYAEPKRDSANFATIIAVNAARNTVVALKTASPEIGDSAVADITNSLSQSPEGPLVVTYPSPWNTMLSPCQLLTAADFARYTGTPASALAGDTLALTDVGDGQMKRSCQRLEVERYNGGEISESNVTVRLAKTSKQAEEYLAGVKVNERDAITIEPVSSAIEGVDESYVRIEGAQKAYQFEMRIGKAFVAVTVKPEIKQESSGEAYAARMLPVAKQVAARFKQLHSQE